ncbi:hypothetical protein FCG67_05245 [Rhodococcus oryzae]|uniref:Uncharacterized protein n=1 Tax=Rhodococcus oryzae TaxID=2571143 RepID=A0ABY2RP68_9NOCA|nr:hypothetical protein [Rhodococcus oryzae]TJZ80272.1 hypothetical protein FCG67_05245 [Rhodococcus oryzae]
MGAIAGFAGLALLANPAVGSAAVAGSFHATRSDGVIEVTFTGISSPTLVGCYVDVVETYGRFEIRGEMALTGDPGSGTYRLTVPDKSWTYFVEPTCVDADGVTSLPGTDHPPLDLAGSAAMVFSS